MSYIDPCPECNCEWKPPNKKGVQHTTCCFHDEPDFTICTCGGKIDPYHPYQVLKNPIHPDLKEEMKHWRIVDADS